MSMVAAQVATKTTNINLLFGCVISNMLSIEYTNLMNVFSNSRRHVSVQSASLGFSGGIISIILSIILLSSSKHSIAFVF